MIFYISFWSGNFILHPKLCAQLRAESEEQIFISNIIKAIDGCVATRMGQNSVGNYSDTLRIYIAKNCHCSTGKCQSNILLTNKYGGYVKCSSYFIHPLYIVLSQFFNLNLGVLLQIVRNITCFSLLNKTKHWFVFSKSLFS